MATPTCASELGKLYDCIVELQTGQAVTSIGFGERQVSYAQADLPSLLRLWSMWYRVCGATSGYPDLSAQTQRGAPAFVRIYD